MSLIPLSLNESVCLSKNSSLDVILELGEEGERKLEEAKSALTGKRIKLVFLKPEYDNPEVVVTPLKESNAFESPKAVLWNLSGREVNVTRGFPILFLGVLSEE